MLVTGAWLIWARSGPKSGAVVAAVRLREAVVTAFNSSLIPDSELEVQYAAPGSPEPGTAFIPLGPETAVALTEHVQTAAAAAGPVVGPGA